MSATIALVLIVLAVVIQVVFLLRRENRRDPVSHWVLAAASVLLAVTLVERSLRIHFVAVTGTYEALVFFSAAVCAVLFALRVIRSTRGLSPFVMFGSYVPTAVHWIPIPVLGTIMGEGRAWLSPNPEDMSSAS